jgi:transcriptional regulator with XRE-family HTH domain
VSTEKTPAQKALVEMRRRLNLTQQQLAARLAVALPTVGRWESTRSPPAKSLLELAAFANLNGEEESKQVFLEAALSIARQGGDISIARKGDDNFEFLEAADLVFPPAAEAAIRYIRLGCANPAVAREYLIVLRTVLASLQVCVDEAIKAHRRGSDFLSLSRLLEVERRLRQELANEEKQTKKR